MSDPLVSTATSTTTVPEGETGTVRASVDTVRRLTWLDSGPGHILLSSFYFLLAMALAVGLLWIVDEEVRTIIIGAIALLLGVFKDTVTRFFQKAGDNE